MTIFTYPTLKATAPQTIRWGQRSNVLVHASLLSGQVGTIELPGARWLIEGQYPLLGIEDRYLLEAFLLQLRGQANKFLLYDFSSVAPRGTFRGSPTISGAHTAGATTITFTGGAGQAGATILKGDKLSVDGQLVGAVANGTANGSGVISNLAIEPPLRKNIANGASVVWDKPTTVFMLIEPQWIIEVEAPMTASFNFSAVEMF